MMSRAEREEADYVLEVERAQRQGRKSAGEQAFGVVLVGFLAAFIIAGAVWEWLFLPVLAGAVWLGRFVYKLRMGQLNVELSNMPVPWDKDRS